MSADKEGQRVSVLTGIVGASVQKEDRELPADAPPPWGESAGLKEVGKRTPRLDAIDKVTGRARYTVDVRRPGMLYARVLRSPHPHARIRGIDTTAAEKMEGVKAVHVLEHLLGTAEEVPDGKQARAEALPTVRYAGQPIAAVAADSYARACAAVARIKVDYEVLPHVVDPDDAQRPGAPLVFARKVMMEGSAGGGGAGGDAAQHGNVRGPKAGGNKGKGEVAAALRGAAVTVSGTYRTQVQTHSPLEPHGLVAEWSPAGDELTVWASTQGLYSVQEELGEVLGLKQSRIRVIMDFCGGGFGAKFGAGNYGVLAAYLARKAKAPVRLCLDRHEEHLGVGNRPGSQQTVTLGAGKDGKLVGIQVLGWGAGGAGAGAGFAGPAQNLYHCPNIYTEESDVFTHTGPLAAFRAPGHPQGVFALEQAMDELAERLGIDPLELRERNDAHPARREERRRGAEVFGWSRRHPAGKGDLHEGAIRRGMGMAQGVWYHLINLNAHAEVRIHRDGGVELLSGVQDIGGGIRTPLAQVVAEELGVPVKGVKVTLGDSRLPPGPGSGGSVTTASITPAARDAAYAARQALLRELAAAMGVPVSALGLAAGKVTVRGDKPRELSWQQATGRMRKEVVIGTGERRPDYGGFMRGPFKRGGDMRGVGQGQLGGVHFAEVAVDTVTGVVRVERVVAAQDCGRPMNPLLVESQVRGGVIQGISYALFEERRLDRRTGLLLNANLELYKIAGARDVPQIDVVLLEELRGRSSTDAGGIGEPATVPTAAAVANAIYNAIGVRVRTLPITPAQVLLALQGAAAGEEAMNPFIWIEARTPEQAVAELVKARSLTGGAAIKAGGVDLLDRMKEGIDTPGRVVSLRTAVVGAPELGEIREVKGSGAGHLHIGALVTLSRLGEDPLVRRHFPALRAAVLGAATPQVRQVATVGGNLLQRPRCWYLRSLSHVCKKKGGTVCFAQEGESDFHAIFDNQVCAAVAPSALATPLWALAASVVAVGEKGARTLRVEDLLLSPSLPGANLLRDHRLDPAEVLTAVQVPLPEHGERNVYLKVKQKQSFDWPLAEVAVVLRRGGPARVADNVRIVLGAAAPTPWRAKAAETELLGLGSADDAALTRVGEAAVRDARPLARNGYKLPLFSGLVKRAVMLALRDGETSDAEVE